MNISLAPDLKYRWLTSRTRALFLPLELDVTPLDASERVVKVFRWSFRLGWKQVATRRYPLKPVA